MIRDLISATAIALVLATGFTTSAIAGVSIEKKVAHFHDPTAGTRTRCVKWAYPWPGAKICVGHAYEVMQRKFYVVVSGPDADQAVLKVLEEAAAAAAAAAIAAGVVSKGLGALPAAKTAFTGYLLSQGLQRMVSQYSIIVDHRTGW